MDRQRQDKINSAKFYISEGDFRRDLWRVVLPVVVVCVLAVFTCLA